MFMPRLNPDDSAWIGRIKVTSSVVRVESVVLLRQNSGAHLVAQFDRGAQLRIPHL